MTDPDPHIGRTLAGQYRIDSLLGSGGMGRVYRGVQLSVNRPVAIKLITGSLPHPPEWTQRFQREAEATARLSHPNSVRLFDFGVTEAKELYMVMELLEGIDLSRHLAEHGRMPLPDVLAIMRQVLLALSEAHALGIVHRDIKPDNIFLARVHGGDQVAKVMDFGIAGLERSRQSVRLTGTGVVIGTPAYMSPEQAQGLAVDSRSDLYSLGVVMFEMLTGQLVFEAETAMSQLMAHITRPPRRLSEAGAQVREHAAVQMLLDGLLAKDPANRPSIGEAIDMVTEIGAAVQFTGTFRARTSLNLQAPAPSVKTAQSVRLPSVVVDAAPAERSSKLSQSATASKTPKSVPGEGQLVLGVPAAAFHKPAPSSTKKKPAHPPGMTFLFRPRKRRSSSFGLVVLFSLLLMAAGGVLALRKLDREGGPHVATPASLDPPEPAPALRSVTIASEPSGANVTLEGALLGTTPYVFRFQQPTDLSVARRGYERQILHVTPESPALLELKLVREPSAKAPASDDQAKADPREPAPRRVEKVEPREPVAMPRAEEAWWSSRLAELAAPPPEVPSSAADEETSVSSLRAAPPTATAPGLQPSAAEQRVRSADDVPPDPAARGVVPVTPAADPNPRAVAPEQVRPQLSERTVNAMPPVDDDEIQRASRHHGAKVFVRIFARAVGKLLIPEPSQARRAELADAPMKYFSFGAAQFAYKESVLDRAGFEDAVWLLRERRRRAITVERDNFARGAITRPQYDARVDRIWDDFWGR